MVHREACHKHLVQGDADNDGDIDDNDLLVWESQYGGVPQLPVTVAVPEPTSLFLALSAFLLLRKRSVDRSRFLALARICGSKRAALLVANLRSGSTKGGPPLPSSPSHRPELGEGRWRPTLCVSVPSKTGLIGPNGKLQQILLFSNQKRIVRVLRDEVTA